jgi:WD40 repeat protein
MSHSKVYADLNEIQSNNEEQQSHEERKHGFTSSSSSSSSSSGGGGGGGGQEGEKGAESHTMRAFDGDSKNNLTYLASEAGKGSSGVGMPPEAMSQKQTDADSILSGLPAKGFPAIHHMQIQKRELGGLGNLLGRVDHDGIGGGGGSGGSSGGGGGGGSAQSILEEVSKHSFKVTLDGVNNIIQLKRGALASWREGTNVLLWLMKSVGRQKQTEVYTPSIELDDGDSHDTVTNVIELTTSGHYLVTKNKDLVVRIWNIEESIDKSKKDNTAELAAGKAEADGDKEDDSRGKPGCICIVDSPSDSEDEDNAIVALEELHQSAEKTEVTKIPALREVILEESSFFSDTFRPTGKTLVELTDGSVATLAHGHIWIVDVQSIIKDPKMDTELAKKRLRLDLGTVMRFIELKVKDSNQRTGKIRLAASVEDQDFSIIHIIDIDNEKNIEKVISLKRPHEGLFDRAYHAATACVGALRNDKHEMLELSDGRLAEFNHDESTVFVWSNDFRDENGEKSQLDCRGDINALIELRDGRLAAAAAREIMIFDPPRNGDGKEKEKEDACFDLDGHRNVVTCIVQLKDGRIASGSKDNSIRIWKVPDSESNHRGNGGMKKHEIGMKELAAQFIKKKKRKMVFLSSILELPAKHPCHALLQLLPCGRLASCGSGACRLWNVRSATISFISSTITPLWLRLCCSLKSASHSTLLLITLKSAFGKSHKKFLSTNQDRSA